MVERIFTIGHSTRSFSDFRQVLDAHGVAQIADVRALPHSRRFPHFGREALEPALAAGDRGYRHFPRLGGLRAPLDRSPNTSLERGLRGYADYMLDQEFDRAVLELLAFAADRATAVMCAEADWSSCHRGLLADALVRSGVQVLHLASAGASPISHALNPAARLVDGRLVYDGRIVRPRGRQKPRQPARRLIE